MRAYENSITINLHCCEEGNWQQEHVDKEQFSEFCQVLVNIIFKCSHINEGLILDQYYIKTHHELNLNFTVL
jgi:hypothetical protein